MLKTLILLGLAGGAAYLAYNQWFKKPSVADLVGPKVSPAGVVQTQAGLSGRLPIGVF